MNIELIVLLVIVIGIYWAWSRRNKGSDDLLKKEEKLNHAIRKMKMEKAIQNNGKLEMRNGELLKDFDFDSKSLDNPEDMLRMFEKNGMKIDDKMKDMFLNSVSASSSTGKMVTSKKVVVNGKTIEDFEEVKIYNDKNGDGKFDPNSGEIEILEIDKDSGEITSDTFEEIKDFLRTGHKISAIKLYKEYTGVGLKEAKDAVELIEKGEVLELKVKGKQGNREIDDEIIAKVKQLMKDKKKIEAIKVYREYAGCGLKEAKDFVETL